MENTSEEYSNLRTISFWMGLSCTILNLLVFFTFIVFEEKRKPAWSPLNFSFTLSIFFFSLVFTLGVGVSSDVLLDLRFVCSAFGSLLFFFAASLVFLWSFITLHLYVRIVNNSEIQKVAPMVFFAYGVSVLAALIANLVSQFEFNGAFCMIPYDNVLWNISIGFFLSCAIIGLVLWLSILWVIVRTYREKKSPSSYSSSSASASASSRPPLSSYSYSSSSSTTPLNPSSPYYYSTSYPYPPSAQSGEMSGSKEQKQIQQSAEEGGTEKYLLVFRQFVFVTGFLIAIIVLCGLHLGDINSNPELAAAIECATLCLISLDSFVVFGINKQNFDLWIAFFRNLCGKSRTSSHVPLTE